MRAMLLAGDSQTMMGAVRLMRPWVMYVDDRNTRLGICWSLILATLYRSHGYHFSKQDRVSYLSTYRLPSLGMLQASNPDRDILLGRAAPHCHCVYGAP